jgi:hypothetical protein
MSQTHVVWKCYGSINTDHPAEIAAWVQMQRELVEVVKRWAHGSWTDGGDGALTIMHDGVNDQP